MTKTWETLFQLTSFMKYFMSEIVLEEETECSGYVLNSLYDLLQVTAACIKRIECDPKLINKSTNEAVLLLQTKNDGTVANSTFSDQNDSSHIQVPVSKACRSSVKNNSNVQTFDDNRQHIPQKFVTLSHEMHCERLFGYYCKPCDSVFYTEESWNEHCNLNEEHSQHNGKLENKYSSCGLCNLVIFSTYYDAQELFHFHSKPHLKHIESASEENLNRFHENTVQNNEIINVDTKKKGMQWSEECMPSPATFENISGISSNMSTLSTGSKGDDIKMDLRKNPDGEIENEYIIEKFKYFNEYIHTSGLKSCLYCILCNVRRSTESECENHYSEKLHLALISNPNFKNIKGICDYCGLTILGSRGTVRKYMLYHSKGHNEVLSYSEEKLNQNTKSILESASEDNFNRVHENTVQNNEIVNVDTNKSLKEGMQWQGSEESMSSLATFAKTGAISSSMSSLSTGSKEDDKMDHRKNPDGEAENKYIFEKFKYLNEDIHTNGLKRCLYCIPCHKMLTTTVDHNIHLSAKLHVALISKSSVKNIKGICDYCNLTILGSTRTVRKYMNYHNKGHNKVISYYEEKLNQDTKSILESTSKDNFNRPHANYIENNKENVVNDGITIDVDTNKSLKKEMPRQGSEECMSNINQASFEKTSDISSSTSSLLSTSSKGNDKKITGRETESIVNVDFKYFNEDIHTSGLKSCLYCIPCNKRLTTKLQREKHYNVKQHLKSTRNPDFNNFKGVCDYCGLTILGNREAIREYMEYHTPGHYKVLSYSEENVNQNIKQEEEKITVGKNKTPFSRKNEISANVSTPWYNDEEIAEDNVSDKISSNEHSFEKRDEQKTDPVTCSTLTSPNGDSFQKICAFIDSRKNSGYCEFFAYCMMCDESYSDAFSWEDHVDLTDHGNSPISKVNISSLNLQFLGNKNELLKLKTLFNGDITFS